MENNFKVVGFEERKEIFKKEIELMKDLEVRSLFLQYLKDMPDYFFTVAASQSGKYHPEISLGDGGLVRHTKAGVQVLLDLLQTKMFDVNLECETTVSGLILAMLIHDSYKCGFEYTGRTEHRHPEYAANRIKKTFQNMLEDGFKFESIDATVVRNISDIVASHMGIWNTSKYDSWELPVPQEDDDFEKIIHLADYIASRKYISEIILGEGKN